MGRMVSGIYHVSYLSYSFYASHVFHTSHLSHFLNQPYPSREEFLHHALLHLSGLRQFSS